MKVLVTGGAGYVGTALVSELIANGIEQVVVYDNLSRINRNFFIGQDKLMAKKIQLIQGDILDSRSLKKALKDVDIVYHLAANVTTPFADQNPHLFEQVNHWGTAELVYAVENSDVKRFIYLSSVSVYGSSEKVYTSDDAPSPRTFYGISKLRGEDQVMRLSEKLKTYIIRCGNVYGYNKSMRFDAVINKFMFEANFKKQISIRGSGEQYRPFIHIDKVSNVLSKISNLGLDKGLYNLVEHNMAIGEVVENLRKIYPKLEMIFVDQHMKMRELRVEGSLELKQLWSLKKTFEEELEDFKRAFTF